MESETYLHQIKKNKMRNIIYSILIMLLLFSCGGGKNSNYKGSPQADRATLAEADMEEPAPILANATKKSAESSELSGSSNVPSEKIPEKIIRNASIRFQVEDYKKSRNAIEEIVKRNEGYISNESENNTQGFLENTLIIRVKYQNFQKLTDELMKEAVYVNYKNISSEDVTDQFVDITSRLKTKKEVEKRYLELLKEARKMEDILNVEDKLRILQEEIESAEGRLKLLNDRVAYSTITLTIYEKQDFQQEPEIGFFKRIGDSFQNGWRFFKSAIVAVLNLWPFMLIALIFLFWLLKRERRRKNN